MERGNLQQSEATLPEVNRGLLESIKDASLRTLGEIARPLVLMAHASLLMIALLPELQLRNFSWGIVRLNVDIDSASAEQIAFLASSRNAKKLKMREDYAVEGANHSRMVLYANSYPDGRKTRTYYSCGDIETHEQYNRTSTKRR
jgi:hypothetical protein